MARAFFRKIVPDEKRLRDNRALRLFGKVLLNRRLWHLNRHSTAFGVACGLFWAWIPLPIQTIGSVAMAMAGRGNIALAMAFTWVSNPLTWVPCFVLAHYVGRLITQTPPAPDLMKQVRAAVDAGPIDGLGMIGRMMIDDLPQLYPMFAGGIAIGAFSSLVGYATVKLTWRWNIVRRWRRRHHLRRRFNPAQRLTSGFAHLARIARRARHPSGSGSV